MMLLFISHACLKQSQLWIKSRLCPSFQMLSLNTWWPSSQSQSTTWRSTARVASQTPCLFFVFLFFLSLLLCCFAVTGRLTVSALVCCNRKGELGEAAAPGHRLRQPHCCAAVLGKLAEDALWRQHPRRVSGGWVGVNNIIVKLINK